ncbi:hypothetical protein LMH87_000922 [Akanthomyces muscarius]|uniref:Uncharacterized protein n=1 Tax=Akanthomyces muscarius TaxID=2231603 RepID=A0A9W8ULK0_AKAMU|nr:hypothetical protein LMH87_000922 [Akanthomyces muscarius]KAJ4155688.1 hypothetical protein LMH87_000922 [Akanthomyces muscarius]
MVYTKSRRIKTLAVATAGLLSLARCAPFPAADSVGTTASATESASFTLTSTPSLANADKAKTASFTPLSTAKWLTSEDNHEAVSEDDLSRFGIAAEQMKTFQPDAPDQELAGPAKDTAFSQTGIAFLNSTLHVKIPTEVEGEEKSVRSRALEITKDERETIKQLAYSQSQTGFWLGLLNGTPYRWELMTVEGEDVSASFSIQLPSVLQPGRSITWKAEMSDDDAHAEVRYNLIGTKEEMWLTLTIHPGFPHKVTVQYGGALETVGLSDSGQCGSVVDLGVDRGVECATFYLTGVEGRFYANDAPPNWMHSMMDDIGEYTLRDVMLPRSHRAGMYTTHKRYGVGNRINTFTQDFSVYYQLKVGGVRVLDLSPLLDKDGSIWESYGSTPKSRSPMIASGFRGTTGVSHDSLVAQINKFNDDFPGELIILDVNGKELRNGKDFKPLQGEGVSKVIDSFKRLKHRAVLVPGKDVTQMPIADIIGSGKSAVVIRMPEDRIPGLPDGYDWPGARKGFVTPAELPVFRQWSNKDDEYHMLYDQVAALQQHRKDGRAQELYEADLLLTLKDKDLFGGTAITALNAPAWVMLVQRFWTAFKGVRYPNWVAMDAIRGSSLRGVAMAVNQCFVAKRCGTFGGRVPGAAAEQVSGNKMLPTLQKVGNGTASATVVNN